MTDNNSNIVIHGIRLAEILDSHKKWLSKTGGQQADLQGANLFRADLRGAKRLHSRPGHWHTASADREGERK